MTELIISGALFSPDRKYRYKLWRRWAGMAKPWCLFIGLNPSTANEMKDDPTIRCCMRFAQKWGYNGIFMGNPYGLVSSDPKKLSTGYPIEHSPGENIKAIMEMSDRSSMVIVAWGSIYRIPEIILSSLVNNLNRPLFCLGVNKDGQPKHPLYLPASTKPQEWKCVAAS